MPQRIYFDTNQLYYIRRIAEEGAGYDFGDYSWAYDVFRGQPDMIADIRSLCYIVALQYQWDLEFNPSDAAYSELFLSLSKRAASTREAWEIAGEGNLSRRPRRLPAVGSRDVPRLGARLQREELGFITDGADRSIVRDCLVHGADVLLTCDAHILLNKDRLATLGISAMKPHEWVNVFLQTTRGDEDALDFLDRILFTVGTQKADGESAFDV